ncbi:hypothetical protein ACFLRF_04880 [Candidatus Altiarchaeota archaeon]
MKKPDALSDYIFGGSAKIRQKRTFLEKLTTFQEMKKADPSLQKAYDKGELGWTVAKALKD